MTIYVVLTDEGLALAAFQDIKQANRYLTDNALAHTIDTVTLHFAEGMDR